jgi:UDP-N-acetylmuramoyl-L-alanyl-D-glutamate--2,6-diaminopimelate ligase
MSAVKKLARKVIPKGAIRKTEDKYRLYKAKTANLVNNYPAKGLRVIAVTGTNGKTTTCSFLNEILKAAGQKTALYTTAFVEIEGKNEFNNTHMTLASAWVVQNFFKKSKKAGVDWVILEVTSHALDQYRILGVPIEVAMITNLSQDHLDYHGTMENYAQAKSRLLTEFKPKVVILNADDGWFDFFAKKSIVKPVTIGKLKATHQIKSIILNAKGTEFKLLSAKKVLNLKTKIVGEFNVYNAAMAAAAGVEIGLELNQIMLGVANVPLVPGRMEPVEAGQPFTVLVDYAVTPDALEKALESLNKVSKGKVRAVFGATGDRDKAKRPIMGEVAAKNADYIYLTDDETYSEDGDKIREAVKEGIIRAGSKDKYVEIADRRQAIKQAFKDSVAGDVVLMAGIGHEDYRNMGGKKEPWDERIVAKKLLKELGY